MKNCFNLKLVLIFMNSNQPNNKHHINKKKKRVFITFKKLASSFAVYVFLTVPGWCPKLTQTCLALPCVYATSFLFLPTPNLISHQSQNRIFNLMFIIPILQYPPLELKKITDNNIQKQQ